MERAFAPLIENLGEGTLLEATSYALGGGKRFRAMLVFLLGDTLGKGVDVSHAAFSVECFHAASLIADDLPCMDDDAFRRGKPSLHKAFGEDVAILASYALIAAGYEGISKNGEKLKEHAHLQKTAEHRIVLALRYVSQMASLATKGQYLDLYPPKKDLPTALDIMRKKTGTLFGVSFVLGWIFGGGDLFLLPLVQEAAMHMGMAYQIADDLDDEVQDGSMNIVSFLGREKASSLREEELASLEHYLQTLHLWSEPFQTLCNHLRREGSFFMNNKE